MPLVSSFTRITYLDAETHELQPTASLGSERGTLFGTTEIFVVTGDPVGGVDVRAGAYAVHHRNEVSDRCGGRPRYVPYSMTMS